MDFSSENPCTWQASVVQLSVNTKPRLKGGEAYPCFNMVFDKKENS
jgi:hypothetical protein